MCKKEIKRNMGGSTRRMCVTNYSGDALWEKGDVLTKLCVSYHLLTGKLGHWRRPADITMVQGWQQKASCCPDSPLVAHSFCLSSALGPSLLPRPLLPVPLALSQSLPSSKGLADVHMHLLSFCRHFLCLGPCQCWFKGII